MTPEAHSHVDIDLLADYIGGTLEGPEEEAVARRIAEDSRWRETYELLAPGMAAVSAELTALGAEPEPMPADLATRLDAAFASPIADPAVIDPAPATPDLAGAGPGASETAPSGTRTARDDARPAPRGAGRRRARGRRRLRWAVPIAAAAGLLAFAGFGADYLAERSGGTDTASSAAGSADRVAPVAESGLVSAPPENRITTSGTDYTDPALQTDAAVGVGTPAEESRTDQKGGASAGTPMVADLGDGALERLRAPRALLTCLDAIARQNGDTPINVESVDYARYQGAPALIVRFDAAGTRWAWATGPDCGAPGRDANVLRRLPVR